ncbi:MAG: ABC transporter permease subunit [Dehalococcoidia bacterium]
MTTEVLRTPTTTDATTATERMNFMNTLASEWMKLTTLRSTYLTLGLGSVLSIAMSALVCLAIGNTFDGWPAERQAQFAPILMSMSGTVVMLIALTVFGVLVASGEYSSGMMRLTLTATPRRARVLVAKLALVTGVTSIVGFVTSVSMFLAGQAVLGSYGIPVADLGDADAQRFVFGLGLMSPLFPVLGAALGMILRSTPGAITASLGLLWLPQVFGEVLPSWPQEHLLNLFPQSAADSLTSGHLVDNPMYSGEAFAGVILLTWVVVFVGAAHFFLQRRDV